jgi:hypothetical protein
MGTLQQEKDAAGALALNIFEGFWNCLQNLKMVQMKTLPTVC